jgi:hypothetical protein
MSVQRKFTARRLPSWLCGNITPEGLDDGAGQGLHRRRQITQVRHCLTCRTYPTVPRNT